jgi:hypothetical protein
MELEAGEESDRDVHLRQLGYTGAVITSDNLTDELVAQGAE